MQMQSLRRWVLIVEDETDIAEAVAKAFTRAGYSTIHCQTAFEAIVKLKNQFFDCVILDIRLKQGTGERVIDYVEAFCHSTRTYIPIFIISGHLDAQLVKRLRGKIEAAFVKPFNPTELVLRVKSLIPS